MGAILSLKHQKAAGGISTKWVSFLCVSCFCMGVFVVNSKGAIKTINHNRIADEDDILEAYGLFLIVLRSIISKACLNKIPCDQKCSLNRLKDQRVHLLLWTVNPIKINEKTSSEMYQVSIPQDNISCEKKESSIHADDILNQVSQAHDVIMTLDRTISNLEMQLAAARAAKGSSQEEFSIATRPALDQSNDRPKVFFVMGIITAFSSRKRRDSIRDTWMPQGGKLQRMEKEKGIVLRFVIGHSATPGGVLDRAINAEIKQHKDFLRLNHVEGYHELSLKTQKYFSTAVAKWDADFYIKVDDDVHVNLATIGSTLARHRTKPHAYVGCMKSGPVLAKQGVKYYEPEYWKFGEVGNKYFRHATGQLYAISKDLATYISVNRHILHRYANEDVSLGSWFIGLNVEHIDERSLCCGTPPDCEWRAQAGNPCAASFDWTCSGICRSADRMEEVHERCGEGEEAIWHTMF